MIVNMAFVCMGSFFVIDYMEYETGDKGQIKKGNT